MNRNLSIHAEAHKSQRSGWLRALVLGANDGIVSIAGLLAGVAAATSEQSAVLIAGVAGWTAGALSMAAGEYVSVSSQRDALNADLEMEAQGLKIHPDEEEEELVRIYQMRGLDRDLAEQVARQLMEKDALGAHLRDELGITEISVARPLQAATVSAVGFTFGAAPIILSAVVPETSSRLIYLFAAALVMLAFAGWLGATLGGANRLRGSIRVVTGGAIAMCLTALIGRWLGAAV